MNEVTIFNKGSWKLEAFELDGVIYFNPKDVAGCLEIAFKTVKNHMSKMNPRQVTKLTNDSISRLTGFRKLHTTGEMFLTESGVYKLALKSRKPEAEAFQDWLCDEVVPAIRKTGGHIPVTPELSDEEIMSRALVIANRTIKEQKRKLERAEKQNVQLSESLGIATEWKQVKAIKWLSEYFVLDTRAYQIIGKALSAISRHHNSPIRKVEDTTYGQVNAYHISMIDIFRERLEDDPTYMFDLRRGF